ncbi:crotonase/enoyl-CoA hydratase family protein [Variovorax sp.]|uniref:crotonase/enoyl-CoA hydratase family protein n=1 Tax=Variovorax sp. TaxID=1871043 RepID=UPI001382EECA|nr:crotonase/enoyl-CoA hydratase family protein [Variovorax sp.]KAF1066738.1 MAG: Methylthioacryloyl-CoA hydratase [Variovorax sp.]
MQYQFLTLELQEEIAHLHLNRAGKRNALNDGLVLELRHAFENLPGHVRAAVLGGHGAHFCAGLDLSELAHRDPPQAVRHSRMWHAALDAIQFGPVPVIAALHGAVIGGGLELAAACHVRVADATAFYALPEGTRGIFVGGGGSVRIPKLTGRVYRADEGERVGFSQYLVAEGKAWSHALSLAHQVARNAPLTNFAVMQALPRIAEQPADHGLMTEALMSAITQSAPEAKLRVQAFLDGAGAKVRTPQAGADIAPAA